MFSKDEKGQVHVSFRRANPKSRDTGRVQKWRGDDLIGIWHGHHWYFVYTIVVPIV